MSLPNKPNIKEIQLPVHIRNVVLKNTRGKNSNEVLGIMKKMVEDYFNLRYELIFQFCWIDIHSGNDFY